MATTATAATRESAMAALAIANHVRVTNARTLRELKDYPYAEGMAIVADMLRHADLSGPCGSIPTIRLLHAVRGLGETKVEDLLHTAEILRARLPLRRLSNRQRNLLANALEAASDYSLYRRGVR